MSAIKFKAKPYSIGAWTVLRLPQAASLKLPSRGQVMVKGTINNQSFQTALEPDGNGGHWLNVDANMQKTAAVKVTEVATLAIEPTKDWPEPVIPADIKHALSSNQPARATWDKTTPMARWEWIRWINSTGQPETRKRRIETACSKLKAGSRRPCCFNRNMCCVPEVSKNGALLEAAQSK